MNAEGGAGGFEDFGAAGSFLARLTRWLAAPVAVVFVLRATAFRCVQKGVQ